MKKESNQQKTIGIYFSLPNAHDYPLDKEVFFEAYAELLEYWEQHSIMAVIVRGNSYKGNGLFDHYFTWDKENATYQKQDSPITVDLIWNKDSHNTISCIKDCPVLNHPDFDELCRDKFQSYQEIPDYSALTILLQSYTDFADNVSKIPTEKVVLKPRYGEGAKGVYVLEKEAVTEALYEDWTDILLQEFLDSSDGIEGLVSGLHEINIAIVNGSFAGARIKQPPKGEFVSSATGAVVGTVWGITQKDIPSELWDIVLELDALFTQYKLRLYRADFVRTTNGTYRLIEINSRPGLMHPEKEGKEFYWNMNGAIADALISYLQSGKE